ncbi:MAG: MFS transporter [Pseudomonadota bacterium]
MTDRHMARNVALFPWFKFGQHLLFWQAVWFLIFQDALSGQEAILLYVLREFTTTALEVPTGVLSDRLGRKRTLVLSVLAVLSGAILFCTQPVFWVFALAQILMGAGEALNSGTDDALFYQSLVALGRGDEIEAQQLRLWRAGFTGLAVSAVVGGVFALVGAQLVFAATAAASACILPLALTFREPPHQNGGLGKITARRQLASLRTALQQPALRWFFVIALMMYAFGHVPFVFGQPFILEALSGAGLSAEAPLASGAVTATMMAVSLGTSHLVPWMRARMGVTSLLLAAFGLQIWLIAMLGLANSVLVIGVLFLRMVPSSLSGPLLIARTQPLLQDDTRATYLSIQSLCGRLLLAGALWMAAFGTSNTEALSYPELQRILWAFAAVGLVMILGLAMTARKLPRT